MVQKRRTGLDVLTTIRDDKIMKVASTFARCVVYEIVVAWWEADCPHIEPALYPNIAGVRTNDWLRHQKRILEILARVMPKIMRFKDMERERAARLPGQAEHARKFIKRTLKNETSNQEAKFIDSKDNHVVLEPISPPSKPFNEGRYDPVARASAMKSTKKPIMFTDAGKTP